MKIQSPTDLLKNKACASPEFCPPVISTAYGVAIHREGAKALDHNKRHLAPGGERSGGSVDLGADGGEATPREVSLEGNC